MPHESDGAGGGGCAGGNKWRTWPLSYSLLVLVFYFSGADSRANPQLQLPFRLPAFLSSALAPIQNIPLPNGLQPSQQNIQAGIEYGRQHRRILLPHLYRVGGDTNHPGQQFTSPNLNQNSRSSQPTNQPLIIAMSQPIYPIHPFPATKDVGNGAASNPQPVYSQPYFGPHMMSGSASSHNQQEVAIIKSTTVEDAKDIFRPHINENIPKPRLPEIHHFEIPQFDHMQKVAFRPQVHEHPKLQEDDHFEIPQKTEALFRSEVADQKVPELRHFEPQKIPHFDQVKNDLFRSHANAHQSNAAENGHYEIMKMRQQQQPKIASAHLFELPQPHPPKPRPPASVFYQNPILEPAKVHLIEVSKAKELEHPKVKEFLQSLFPNLDPAPTPAAAATTTNDGQPTVQTTTPSPPPLPPPTQPQQFVLPKIEHFEQPLAQLHMSLQPKIKQVLPFDNPSFTHTQPTEKTTPGPPADQTPSPYTFYSTSRLIQPNSQYLITFKEAAQPQGTIPIIVPTEIQPTMPAAAVPVEVPSSITKTQPNSTRSLSDASTSPTPQQTQSTLSTEISKILETMLPTTTKPKSMNSRVPQNSLETAIGGVSNSIEENIKSYIGDMIPSEGQGPDQSMSATLNLPFTQLSKNHFRAASEKIHLKNIFGTRKPEEMSTTTESLYMGLTNSINKILYGDKIRGASPTSTTTTTNPRPQFDPFLIEAANNSTTAGLQFYNLTTAVIENSYNSTTPRIDTSPKNSSSNSTGDDKEQIVIFRTRLDSLPLGKRKGQVNSSSGLDARPPIPKEEDIEDYNDDNEFSNSTTTVATPTEKSRISEPQTNNLVLGDNVTKQTDVAPTLASSSIKPEPVVEITTARISMPIKSINFTEFMDAVNPDKTGNSSNIIVFDTSPSTTPEGIYGDRIEKIERSTSKPLQEVIPQTTSTPEATSAPEASSAPQVTSAPEVNATLEIKTTPEPKTIDTDVTVAPEVKTTAEIRPVSISATTPPETVESTTLFLQVQPTIAEVLPNSTTTTEASISTTIPDTTQGNVSPTKIPADIQTVVPTQAEIESGSISAALAEMGIEVISSPNSPTVLPVAVSDGQKLPALSDVRPQQGDRFNLDDPPSESGAEIIQELLFKLEEAISPDDTDTTPGSYANTPILPGRGQELIQNLISQINSKDPIPAIPQDEPQSAEVDPSVVLGRGAALLQKFITGLMSKDTSASVEDPEPESMEIFPSASFTPPPPPASSSPIVGGQELISQMLSEATAATTTTTTTTTEIFQESTTSTPPISIPNMPSLTFPSKNNRIQPNFTTVLGKKPMRINPFIKPMLPKPKIPSTAAQLRTQNMKKIQEMKLKIAAASSSGSSESGSISAEPDPQLPRSPMFYSQPSMIQNLDSVSEEESEYLPPEPPTMKFSTRLPQNGFSIGSGTTPVPEAENNFDDTFNLYGSQRSTTSFPGFRTVVRTTAATTTTTAIPTTVPPVSGKRFFKPLPIRNNYRTRKNGENSTPSADISTTTVRSTTSAEPDTTAPTMDTIPSTTTSATTSTTTSATTSTTTSATTTTTTTKSPAKLSTRPPRISPTRKTVPVPSEERFGGGQNSDSLFDNYFGDYEDLPPIPSQPDLESQIKPKIINKPIQTVTPGREILNTPIEIIAPETKLAPIETPFEIKPSSDETPDKLPDKPAQAAPSQDFLYDYEESLPNIPVPPAPPAVNLPDTKITTEDKSEPSPSLPAIAGSDMAGYDDIPPLPSSFEENKGSSQNLGRPPPPGLPAEYEEELNYSFMPESNEFGVAMKPSQAPTQKSSPSTTQTTTTTTKATTTTTSPSTTTSPATTPAPTTTTTSPTTTTTTRATTTTVLTSTEPPTTQAAQEFQAPSTYTEETAPKLTTLNPEPTTYVSSAPEVKRRRKEMTIVTKTGPSYSSLTMEVTRPLMPTTEPATSNDDWLREVALKALDRGISFQQVFSINIGNILLKRASMAAVDTDDATTTPTSEDGDETPTLDIILAPAPTESLDSSKSNSTTTTRVPVPVRMNKEEMINIQKYPPIIPRPMMNRYAPIPKLVMLHKKANITTHIFPSYTSVKLTPDYAPPPVAFYNPQAVPPSTTERKPNRIFQSGIELPLPVYPEDEEDFIDDSFEDRLTRNSARSIKLIRLRRRKGKSL